ncbi:MAG TPA: ferrochelatase [Caldithrix abyssi]|uniref:Ferrochelatase n=1 Tax=Caldithrix abyssi TaxID=187145 RepID=A0A7V5H4Z1_CALAY|nr:ferrochelatase [Caldithrix abyssi]
MKIAVLLANMGGPDSLEAVEPFLTQIFSDPDIIDIPLPEFVRKPLVRWLAKKRAPESRGIYEKLGGKTPLLEITEQQALALKQALSSDTNHRFEVFPAMRYWHPFMEKVWQKIEKQDFDRIVVLSMYPFYSTTTSGSIKNELNRLIQKYNTPPGKVKFIDRFGTHPLFVQSMVELLKENLTQEDRQKPKHVLFSAHSIPIKRINNGDPYFEEVKQAVDLLRAHFPEEEVKFHLSFQSKLGPIEWLSPATDDKIEELASQGIKQLLVFPLGFVADNSETVYEIGMLYQKLAQEKGIEDYRRIEALNVRPMFIEALKQIVLENVEP